MVEPSKKSTEALREVVWQNERETVQLDSRLALRGVKDNWLAVSDLHYGYEVRRRVKGGLWPMWGREAIESRLGELLDDYKPECLILNGDIVDGASPGTAEVIEWLKTLQSRCGRLILIEGNHDRGLLLREMKFVTQFQIGDFMFHHGHLPMRPLKTGKIEVVGHLHPSIRLRDGAGLSIKLPSLVQESWRWIMPAFSPWAGGVNYEGKAGAKTWACSSKRIFRVP